MHMTIKKPLLISLFVCYQFFMPFVMSCGVDTPYDKTTQQSDTEATSTIDNCDTDQFLTADCVAAAQSADTSAALVKNSENTNVEDSDPADDSDPAEEDNTAN